MSISASQNNVFSELLNAQKKAVPTVMVTVIEVKGSAPQKAGARMLVYSDGRISGTIGGGAIEKKAIEFALSLKQNTDPQFIQYELETDAEMLCGGHMSLFFEPMNPPKPLYIFGAGHIGHALCRILEGAGFAITIIDNRPEYANPEGFPAVSNILAKPYPKALDELVFTEQTSIVIVTHGHAYDQEVLEYCIQKPFHYLGMIGSRRKVKQTVQNLIDKGISPELFKKLHSPIGLDIGGDTPTEIAVSIAAELIAVKNNVTEIQKPNPAQDIK
ncbi:xanthine dehydrogenase accessory protein XdhC [candidate division KSB1 bacterium]|nr:xanthine dehydrogenase accessory protein XdhC [candidate division KSB1 bacterium]